jgi:allophanate hydrolase
MAVIEVVAPGARTLVQDDGFRRGRSLGVPRCGAMDRRALALVNALVGNPPGTEALEIALLPPLLRAAQGPVRIALSGSLSAVVRQIDGTERPVGPWCATTLAPGETLHPAPPARGGLGLIGIGGGIDLPRVLGSRSTCLRAGFGGMAGRALLAGDRLSCPDADPGLPDLGLVPPPDHGGPIRVVSGPQAEWFGPAARARLFGTGWRVTPQCDRMGLRLDGPPLDFAPGHGPDIVSDGIAPGAIQVPGNGRPIILLADAQTTGGYAKIATVIRADLSRLAALVPGDEVRFAPVTVAEAEAAARAGAAAIAASIATIAPLARRRPGTADLLGANLVGGVVDTARPDHFPGHLD